MEIISTDCAQWTKLKHLNFFSGPVWHHDSSVLPVLLMGWPPCWMLLRYKVVGRFPGHFINLCQVPSIHCKIEVVEEYSCYAAYNFSWEPHIPPLFCWHFWPSYMSVGPEIFNNNSLKRNLIHHQKSCKGKIILTDPWSSCFCLTVLPIDWKGHTFLEDCVWLWLWIHPNLHLNIRMLFGLDKLKKKSWFWLTNIHQTSILVMVTF